MVKARWLLAALLVVPLVDAAFLVVVADRIGPVATVLIVVLTALLGTVLVRAEGRRTLRKIQESLARGDPPTDELIDGGFLIASGALLLTPGLVTDAIGFAFALPLTRIPLRMALKKYVVVPYLDSQTDGFATGNVYTFGFPNGGDRSGVDPADYDLGDDPDDDGAAGSSTGRTGSSGGDTVDLGHDEYDVDSAGTDTQS